MNFLIADTFTDALARLPAQEQKAAKISAFDLRLNPSAPGLQFHRIDKSKDQNFWSMRVNRDLRIIVHKTAASVLLAYVDHHDKAYAWAERRRIEAHPRTGAVQIVEVRERVEEIEQPAFPGFHEAPASFAPVPTNARPAFAGLGENDLLAVGVPIDWIGDVLAATEDRFLDLAAHLPAEAAEALLEYAATGRLPARAAPPLAEVALPDDLMGFQRAPTVESGFAHPDARRRFRTIENVDELRAALDAPWDRWSVFLHPSQRAVVERAYAGPARVAGSAGTGKTVVALHRAARLARTGPEARVLLTTFSEPLARALKSRLDILDAFSPSAAGRVTVAPWRGLGDELHQLAFGRRPRTAKAERVRAALVEAARAQGVADVSERFLVAEFVQVVDAWQVKSLAEYAETPRLGRRTRLGARQRERLWPVFEAARAALARSGMVTWPEVFARLTAHYAALPEKPFTHIVVDEAQDLGVPELRLLRSLAPDGTDTLFLAGDLGQRIFQPPFSWKALGVDVRGRSATLKVNYRTSHQIRSAADRLLPAALRDVDGAEEVRRGTISVFEGPVPDVAIVADFAAETARAAAFIAEARAGGIAPAEIGVFVRSRAELERARAAVSAAGLRPVEEAGADEDGVLVGTMHLAKGLEFKAVLVLACDADVLPLRERIEAVTDEVDLDEVYETERHLLYVACTRARDRLLVAGVAPGSEFVSDLTDPSP